MDGQKPKPAFRFMYFTEIGGVMEGPFLALADDMDEYIRDFRQQYAGSEPAYANVTVLDFGDAGVPAFTQEDHTNPTEEENP